jgi:hypothetical protein
VRRAGQFALLALSVSILGCSNRPGVVPVEGIVLLDGNPLEGATVTFLPQGDHGRPASGRTDSTGAFHLTTFDKGDGAMPGEYRVVVKKTTGRATQPTIPSDGASGKEHYKDHLQAKAKPALPPRYSNETQTPFTCTVPPPQRVSLELQSKP